MNNRIGDWIQTYSGKQFWPFNPDSREICIEDIAHALSNLCRFGGHCIKFYSVAEHSIYVSHEVDQQYALEGLLHDAAETYVVDVPRPIKNFLTSYQLIETSVKISIDKHFGIKRLPQDVHKHIKKVDNALLADEAEQVMVESPTEWYLPEKGLGVKIKCWSPQFAEWAFLQRYYEIIGE